MKKLLSLILIASVLLISPNLALAAVPQQTSPLVISVPTSSILPSGNVGTIYGVGLSALGGGSRPVTWSIISGKLPVGLSIIKNWGNSSTMINGTPTRAETATFTVQATDKSGNKTSRVFTLTVNPPLPLTVTNPSSTFINGSVGVAYATNLFASGGVQPYTWAITAGQLPPGLRLSGNQISGTPTTAGTYSFTARVTDATGVQASQNFSITIQ